MPKRFFKRLAPDPESIKKSRSLSWLGTTLHHPGLWHFNRRSVAGAFAVGLFCMWIPFPPQTLMSAIVAVLVRVNLPVSVALVYVTNPVTIPPMFFAAYQLGAIILGEPIQAIGFDLSYEWLHATMAMIWQPLLLGLFIVAVVSALLGYYGILLFWRLHIMQRIKLRRQQRREKQHNKNRKS